jgi:hypothetical protein
MTWAGVNLEDDLPCGGISSEFNVAIDFKDPWIVNVLQQNRS